MSFCEYILDINALKENAQKYKQITHSKLCAMIKADAYGHCANVCAKALDGIADFFGVATYEEAKLLKKANIKTPILIVGVLEKKAINYCAKNHISVAITSIDDALMFSKNTKSPINIHLKINTGMNRYGFSNFDDFLKGLELLESNKNIHIEGIFTHFACKKDNKKFTQTQYKKFMKYVKIFKNPDLIVHCCEGYAGLASPKMRMSMVRVGFALYGWQAAYKFLKPVVSIKTKIVNVHNIMTGEGVGYDRNFVAPKNMRIGVIPLGYADGFDRRLSNAGYVLVNGKRANVLGNVCMDAFMIDITDIDSACNGSIVTILGKDNDEVLSPKTYAEILGTSEYEILVKFRNNRMNLIVK